MKGIEVSVIMPCFNDGQYLLDAIESVNIKENTQVEIVIVDDGSTDEKTKRILKQVCHERIRVLHREHAGPSAARNEGIEHAYGDYILPLDADDRIESTYINKAVEILKKNSKIGVVYCYADLFGKAKGRWKLPDYSFERMLVDNIVFVTAFYRKEDWKKVGGYRTDMKYGLEDYDFFLSILEMKKSIYQIPEVLFHYRIKSCSRTTAFMSDKEQVKETYRTLYEHHIPFYQEHAGQYAMLLRNELIEQKFKFKWLRWIKAKCMNFVSMLKIRKGI